jgi:hypothetical protein
VTEANAAPPVPCYCLWSWSLFYRDDLVLGRRRQYLVRVLDSRGAYPDVHFTAADALYVAGPSLAYTVVLSEPPNEYGWSEIAWNDLAEVRLWGALALSIREGQGFFALFPSRTPAKSLFARELPIGLADKVARHTAGTGSPPSYRLHWVKPSRAEVDALYAALQRADVVLLRGLNCFLKSLALWQMEDSQLLMEAMCLNLHISLEAGLSVLRRRLSVAARQDVSFQAVYHFLSATLTHGGALVEFWQDRRAERNLLMHPDSHSGPYVIAPMSADDVYELWDPMLSLYRFLLIGDFRPA